MITFSIFLILISFFSYDLYVDMAENLPLRHLWHEVILFLIAIVGAVWQLILLFSKDKKLLATKDSYKEWPSLFGFKIDSILPVEFSLVWQQPD